MLKDQTHDAEKKPCMCINCKMFRMEATVEDLVHRITELEGRE